MNPEDKRHLLVVEDDPEMGLLMKMVFENEGYSVALAQTGRDAVRSFETGGPCAVLLDLKLPDMYGLDLLEKLKKIEPDVPMLILTGYGEIETAVEAIKKGAYHFLCKPFQNAELLLLVKKALAESHRERELAALRQRLSQAGRARYAVGRGALMAEVIRQVERVAPTDMTVILEGESGVGKEVLAGTLHQRSLRRDGPFIAVDCGTLPEGLVESELFGYEKGAFTGADRRKLGQFELAHGGTLFLDEVANLAAPVQAKLLRVLQERSVQHLGGRRSIPVDVRILAASNRALYGEVQAGRFREDLYHRLNEFTIVIPPLRHRPEDIPELVDIFLEESSRSLRKELRGVSPQALELLRSAPWPGNIRQLKNTLRAGALMADGLIEAGHLQPFLAQDAEVPTAASVQTSPLKAAAQEAEREAILDALQRTGQNKAKAARLLNIDRSALYDKMRRLNIKV
ncbi:MAG: sigma-54 dependent transcriptional regulator [Elusimicrobiota bacterium]